MYAKTRPLSLGVITRMNWGLILLVLGSLAFYYFVPVALQIVSCVIGALALYCLLRYDIIPWVKDVRKFAALEVERVNRQKRLGIYRQPEPQASMPINWRHLGGALCFTAVMGTYVFLVFAGIYWAAGLCGLR